jgi:translation elongation factor EF-Tu-like GTPase
MTKHLKSKLNQHINVGTIGHIDHGLPNISNGVQGCIIRTGDYINPALCTPEDHTTLSVQAEEGFLDDSL